MESVVQITLNGELRDVPERLSVAELVRHLGLKAEHVAVELNKGLVTRARQDQTPVSRRRRARGRDLGWRRGRRCPGG